MDETVTETSLYAQETSINITIGRGYADNSAVFDVQIKLAANAAIGASGLDLLTSHWRPLPIMAFSVKAPTGQTATQLPQNTQLDISVSLSVVFIAGVTTALKPLKAKSRTLLP